VPPSPHHRVYVVRLANPRGDGRDGYYVGMTGLPLEERFANHKRGHKSASIVRRYGVELAWDLFEGIPAMSYAEAALAEPSLADDLRDLGYLVYGPTNRSPALPRGKKKVARRAAVAPRRSARRRATRL
jgi:predicted GIY-YIG superfamily endonuclease